MRFPDWSPYWITVPLGVAMFVFLIYTLNFRKVPQDPDRRPLFFLSVERFIFDPDARTKILSVLLLIFGLWIFKMNHQIRHLEVEMIRYVLPRQLTKDQIEAFGQYLKSNSKPHEVKIKYIMGDAEAQGYAGDFASGFKAGNWVPNMMPINPAGITCHANPSGGMSAFACSSELQQMINRLEGVAIEQSGPNPPPPSSLEEKLNPTPYLSQIVSQALTAAGIQGIGSGYGYSNDPPNTITVFVGFRKRDKFAVLPPKFGRGDEDLSDIRDDDF